MLILQVCDFVKSLPGCSDYVEDFQLQEIDGQALMLLKADHLMSAMAIKLGPALKICSAIDAMREELKQVISTETNILKAITNANYCTLICTEKKFFKKTCPNTLMRQTNCMQIS
jgi:hypothetical protein